MLYASLILGLLATSAVAGPASPLSVRTSCSTPDGSGTCISTSSCGSSGFSVAGYCAGSSDIQCCVQHSCSTSSGSGKCLATSSGCSGTFISGACPGPSNVECCVGKVSCSTSSGSGTCQSTSSSCSGTYIAGACPGASNIECCVPKVSCSTSSGSGTCLSTSSSCAGTFIPGACPGASNIECCVPKVSCSTSSGSGTCLSTSSSCDGTFIPGACPGASNIECCVAGGGNPGGNGQISSAAVSLIESEEGFSSTFYDINGDETIGYGHDCTQQGDCSSIHAPITQAQGQALLETDLKSFESCVCALPNASGLNINQFGALVSFTYNSGCGGVQTYFESYMQQSDFSGICSALPTTNTLGGELSGRRAREGAFCSMATSTRSGC